ncbi:hypothetical protein D3C85_1910400 [compost metagenome]
MLKVSAVNVCDFQLTALGRLDVLGDLDNLIVVKIETGDCIARLGLLRFFFNA